MNFKYSTFRRYYLDKFLSVETFAGRILDVGGKKENKRGAFAPILDNVDEWIYLNIDSSTSPDILASADNIPFPNDKLDMLLLVEVLEHLEKPEASLSEAYRVLRKGGRMILTAPFLYPFHGDPNDFQRWTHVKLKRELEQLGFEKVEVLPMGGVIAVTFDIFRHYIVSKNSTKFVNRALRVLLLMLLPLERIIKAENTVSSGWYVKAVK